MPESVLKGAYQGTYIGTLTATPTEVVPGKRIDVSLELDYPDPPADWPRWQGPYYPTGSKPRLNITRIYEVWSAFNVDQVAPLVVGDSIEFWGSSPWPADPGDPGAHGSYAKRFYCRTIFRAGTPTP